jgi:hypothetical protein
MELEKTILLDLGGSGTRLKKILFRGDSFGIFEIILLFFSRKVPRISLNVSDGCFQLNSKSHCNIRKYQDISILNGIFLNIYGNKLQYVYDVVKEENIFDMFQLETWNEDDGDILLNFCVLDRYIQISIGKIIQ